MEENKNVAQTSGETEVSEKNENTQNNVVNRTNNKTRTPNRGSRGFQRRPTSRNEEEYDERVVEITKVSKTVKGGKNLRFSALVVIGDKKGKFGYGKGKAKEVPEAIKKALAAAKRNMFTLEVAKNDSIAHQITGEFGATKVFLKPAPEGTGLVAGGPVRAILELAGVKNVYSKIYGSRNKTNVVKATVDGLNNLKSYKQVEKVRYNKDSQTNSTASAN